MERLMHFATALECDVVIEIRPRAAAVKSFANDDIASGVTVPCISMDTSALRTRVVIA